MKSFRSCIALVILCLSGSLAFAADKPNIVIVFLDNFGWGEPGFNGGGIIRGAATPNLDQIAAEGLRLTNFNIEVQCTPSRSALMTGRYAIRSGNGTVPLGEGVYGLVQWEVTMAEMLSAAGYATGMFGKWHLGRTEGRFPTDQGFDEWYGIPNSTDESVYSQMQGFDESGVSETWFMEGRLVPGRHYVLLRDDYADVEEKFHYFMENTDEALAIIANAKAYAGQFASRAIEQLISLKVVGKYLHCSEQT